MAGRVLRDSKGRYAGSTRGWGAGRRTHGGGFGPGIKGKSRSVRAHRAIQVGKSVGIALAGNAIGLAATPVLLRSGVSPAHLAVGALATGVAYQASKKVIRREMASARRRRR